MSTVTTRELSAWQRFFREWHFPVLLERWAWRWRRALWLSIVASYLLSFNGLWRFAPDSGLYLSIARNIAHGQGYVYNGEVNRMAYPGLPYLLAGLMKISEKHAIVLADAVMLIFGLLAIVMCYRMLRLIVRPGAAMLLTTFSAEAYIVYKYAFMVMTDTPFFLGSMMVLGGGALSGLLPAPRLDETVQEPTSREKKLGYVLLGLGLALCAVMRPTFYVLAGCVLLASVVNAVRSGRKRYIAVTLGLAACIVLLYVLVAQTDPRRDLGTQDIYEEAVSVQLRTAVTDWRQPLGNAQQLIYADLPMAFYGFSWTDYGNIVGVTLLVGATVWVLWRWPMALLWVGGTLAMQTVVEPVQRYMMPIFPLLLLGWWEAAVRIGRKVPWRVSNTLTILVFCLMIPSAARSVSVWYEQYRQPFYKYYRAGSFDAVWEAALAVKARVPADAVLIVPEKTGTVFTYLTDHVAIELTEVNMERYRERRVWVVFPQGTDMRKRLADRGFGIGPDLGQSFEDHRGEGVLLVAPARWPAGAHF